MEVDGEVFAVKVTPVGGEPAGTVEASIKDETDTNKTSKETPEGAVMSDMAGLVLSLEVKAGDRVVKGDQLAVIEAMKMRRPVPSPFDGTIKEIYATEGQVVDIGDILMLVV